MGKARGARTDTLQSLGEVVVAVATVTGVAWGRVHAHTMSAHLTSEQLALIHICGRDGQRRTPPPQRERWVEARDWGLDWERGGGVVKSGKRETEMEIETQR